MNTFNIKRVENVIDKLDELEEELVPCFTEEDQRLRALCETEMFSDRMLKLDVRVSALEGALRLLKSCRDNLKCVLEDIKEENDGDKED